MFSFRKSQAASFAAVVAIALALACNSSKTQPAQNNQIIGAGSTFINPIMTHWIADFQSSHPGVQINYQSIGSGGGIQQLKQGLVDFGASDAALDDQQLKEMPALVQIPESAGPVCITYNLPELKEPLKLSAATLVGIYLGRIKSWQDPAVTKDNSGISLPKHAVAVTHRSDGSGTTYIFTDYLSTVSHDWATKVGKNTSVNWPTGVGGKTSDGVSGQVKQLPGAIGYVELAYATQNKLPVAELKNAAGKFVLPSPESVSKAMATATIPDDFRFSMVNAPGEESYPIAGASWALLYQKQENERKGKAVVGFLKWCVTEGQKLSPKLDYAPLPDSVQQRAVKALETVTY